MSKDFCGAIYSYIASSTIAVVIYVYLLCDCLSVCLSLSVSLSVCLSLRVPLFYMRCVPEINR